MSSTIRTGASVAFLVLVLPACGGVRRRRASRVAGRVADQRRHRPRLLHAGLRRRHRRRRGALRRPGHARHDDEPTLGEHRVLRRPGGPIHRDGVPRLPQRHAPRDPAARALPPGVGDPHDRLRRGQRGPQPAGGPRASAGGFAAGWQVSTASSPTRAMRSMRCTPGPARSNRTNVVTVFAHDAPSTAVVVDVDPSSAASAAFGVFAPLPSPPQNPWPAPGRLNTSLTMSDRRRRQRDGLRGPEAGLRSGGSGSSTCRRPAAPRGSGSASRTATPSCCALDDAREAPMSFRPRSWCSRPLVAVALAAACGPATTALDGRGEPVLLTTSPLSADTTLAVFAVGPGPDFTPLGGEGQRRGGSAAARVPRRSRPLGGVARRSRRRVRAAEPRCAQPIVLAAVGAVHPRYRQRFVRRRERRTQRAPRFSHRADAIGCAHVGVDPVSAIADYIADPLDPWFGAPGGRNVVHLYVDDWGAGAAISIDADTGAGPSPFGLFAALPDTTGGGSWPDPSTWTTRLDLTADTAGDVTAYLVARPGARPVLWTVAVTNGGTGETTGAVVRGGDVLRLRSLSARPMRRRGRLHDRPPATRPPAHARGPRTTPPATTAICARPMSATRSRTAPSTSSRRKRLRRRPRMGRRPVRLRRPSRPDRSPDRLLLEHRGRRLLAAVDAVRELDVHRALRGHLRHGAGLRSDRAVTHRDDPVGAVERAPDADRRRRSVHRRHGPRSSRSMCNTPRSPGASSSRRSRGRSDSVWSRPTRRPDGAPPTSPPRCSTRSRAAEPDVQIRLRFSPGPHRRRRPWDDFAVLATEQRPRAPASAPSSSCGTAPSPSPRAAPPCGGGRRGRRRRAVARSPRHAARSPR